MCNCVFYIWWRLSSPSELMCLNLTAHRILLCHVGSKQWSQLVIRGNSKTMNLNMSFLLQLLLLRYSSRKLSWLESLFLKRIMPCVYFYHVCKDRAWVCLLCENRFACSLYKCVKIMERTCEHFHLRATLLVERWLPSFLMLSLPN